MDRKTEDKISELLAQLTLEEKALLCAGDGKNGTNEVPRLGIHCIRMVDGPQGVRVNHQPGGAKTTALPCGMALAASWDPELAERYGRAIALDAKALGFSVSLGPGMNLMRTPLCGRNFEYYGEDPVLAGRIAAGYIRGCQAAGVAATPKHFALNNQEICRLVASSDADERTIRELYLAGFEIAVRTAAPWLVMSSYNRINGTHASECGWLQDLIAKREWGFDGVMVSDWGGAHDTAGCMLGGLDLAMGGPGTAYPPERMTALVRNGLVPEAVLDEMVRRILRLLFRAGAIGQPVRPTGKVGGAKQRATAAEAAAKSAVLLKNDRDFLPLDRKKVRRILLTGPNADFRNHRGTLCFLGGSGAVFSDREVTLRVGLAEYAARHGIELDYMPHLKFDHDRDCPPGFFGPDGLECVYYRTADDLAADRDRIASVPNFDGLWDFTAGGSQAAGDGHPDLPTGVFAARIRGKLAPQSPAPARLFVAASYGALKVRVGGAEVFRENGCWTVCEHRFGAGEAPGVELEIEYLPQHSNHSELRIGWEFLADANAQKEQLLAAARTADAVIFAGGVHHLYDRECIGGDVYDPTADIPDLALPGGQAEEIAELASVNPRIAVLLVGGSVMDVEPWIDRVAAIADLWYPGEAGGSVAAQLLFGELDFEGHLPFTWGRKLDDYACHASGNYPGTVTDADPRVRYAEGLYIGYRHFDRAKIAPRFPFGHGLSYAKFTAELRDFRQTGETDTDVGAELRVAVKNVSGRAGSELIQVYVGAADPGFDRPDKELKAFAKVRLEPGEEREVTLRLSLRDFACWHPEKHHWCVPQGEYVVGVGRTAEDIFARRSVIVR